MSSTDTSAADQAANIDWQAIDESIQAIFATLADAVRSKCPSIHSRGGKTQTSRFPLFSYRVFEVPSAPQLDPVVAGVDFAPASSGSSIVVRADFCGDENGRIWFELPKQTLPPIQDVLQATAETLARDLSAQSDCIIAALNQQTNSSSPGHGTQANGMGVVTKEYERHS